MLRLPPGGREPGRLHLALHTTFLSKDSHGFLQTWLPCAEMNANPTVLLSKAVSRELAKTSSADLACLGDRYLDEKDRKDSAILGHVR